MASVRLAMVLTATVLSVPACSGESGSNRDATSRPPRPNQETAALTSPAMCTESSVRTTVEAFLASYNAGESDLVDRFIAKSRFAWYSDPKGRLQSASYPRSTLDSFLAARQAEGDRLILDEFWYVGGEVGNFHGYLQRSSRESPSRRVPFKGAVDCTTDRIMVWSLGG